MPSALGQLRPSGSKQWLLCPGSVAAEQAYANESNPAADEGTRAHTLLEYCLLNGVSAAAVDTIQDPINAGEIYEIPDDMAVHIQTVLDYVYSKGGQVYAEAQVDASSKMGFEPGVIKGTSDVCIIVDQTLEIVDLKYGQGVYVSEVDNSQEIIYGAGTLALFDATPFTKVITTIAQPRYRGGEPIRSHEYAMEEFEAKLAEIATGAQAALSPQAPRVPGEEQCRWCRAKGDCAERLGKVTQLIDGMFPTVHEAVTTGGNTISDENLSYFLDRVPLVEGMIKDVKAEVFKRLQNGRQIPRYKLVAGSGRRKWIDEQVTFKKLKGFKVGGKCLGQDKAAPRSVLSPAQAEKVAGITDKQRKILDTLWEKKPGNPIVALASDPRPSISTAVEFAPVTDEVAPATEPVEIPDFM